MAQTCGGTPFATRDAINMKRSWNATALALIFMVALFPFANKAAGADHDVKQAVSLCLEKLIAATNIGDPAVRALNMRLAASEIQDFEYMVARIQSKSVDSAESKKPDEWLDLYNKKQKQLENLYAKSLDGALENKRTSKKDKAALKLEVENLEREVLLTFVRYIQSKGLRAILLDHLVTNARVNQSNGVMYRYEFYVPTPAILVTLADVGDPGIYLSRGQLIVYNSFASPTFDRVLDEANIRFVGRETLLNLLK